MRIENIGSHPAVEDPHAQGALEYEILFQRLVFVHALIVNQGGRGEGVFPHLSQKQYQPRMLDFIQARRGEIVTLAPQTTFSFCVMVLCQYIM